MRCTQGLLRGLRLLAVHHHAGGRGGPGASNLHICSLFDRDVLYNCQRVALL